MNLDPMKSTISALTTDGIIAALESLQSEEDEPAVRMVRALMIDEYAARTSEDAAEALQDSLCAVRAILMGASKNAAALTA